MPITPEREPTLADRTLDILRRYVSVLVVGVLGLWLLPRAFRGAADTARGRPLPSLGVGVLGFVGVVVALGLLVLVTVLVAVMLGLGALLLTARPGRRAAEPAGVSPAGDALGG